MAHLVGLVFLCFGIISSYLLNENLYYFSTINLVLGFVFIFYYLLRGGLKRNNFLKLIYKITYPLLFLIFVFLLNAFITKHDPLYFDSTKQKVYSLAPQTKEILTNLKEDVVIRGFFVGGEISPQSKSLLERLAKANTHIKLQLLDPVKVPQLAEKYGISDNSTLHVSIGERFVKLTRNMEEQDLANAILKLSRGSEKKVYFLGGDFEDKSQTGYLLLKEAVEGENLLIEKLDLISKPFVPKDAAALILLPISREYLEPELNAISNYLKSGGNALVSTSPGAKINDLFKDFALEVGNDVILDEVVKLAEGPTLVLQPVITDFNDHPITDKIKEGIVLTSVNSVSKNINLEVPELKITELAFSGEKSWAEKNLKLIFSDNPQASFDSDDKKGPISIAAAVEGKGRLVVIGDADFVNNLNIRQLFNKDFYLNSLNWVIGEQAGLNIRASTIQGSTKKITDSQMKLIFLTSGLIFPELIAILGLFLWWRRRG